MIKSEVRVPVLACIGARQKFARGEWRPICMAQRWARIMEQANDQRSNPAIPFTTPLRIPILPVPGSNIGVDPKLPTTSFIIREITPKYESDD